MMVYRGIQTWILVVPEDKRSQVYIALQNAKIPFREASSVYQRSIKVVEVRFADADGPAITKAINPI